MLSKFAKYALVLGITAFFAVMWGLMLRPHLAVPTGAGLRPDYVSLLKPGEKERTTSWGIYFGGNRIGRSEMLVRQQEDGTIVIRTDAEIKLDPAVEYVLGLVGTLDVKFLVNISPLRGLLLFQADSKLLDTSLQGAVRDDEILLRGHVGKERIRTSIPYDADGLLAEAFSPLAGLPELKRGQVGRNWTMDMVNPVAGTLQKVSVSIARSKEITLADRTVRVFQLSFATGAGRWNSWVTEDGEVLVQGTPFGLSLRREDLPADVLTDLRAVTPEPSQQQ